MWSNRALAILAWDFPSRGPLPYGVQPCKDTTLPGRLSPSCRCGVGLHRLLISNNVLLLSHSLDRVGEVFSTFNGNDR